MIADLFEAVLLFLSRWFGKKDPATQVAKTANKDARIEAETTRQTTTSLNQELSHDQAQTDADLALVRASQRMRDLNAATRDAVDRANGDVP